MYGQYKVAIALLIGFFEKQFNEAMVIFSTKKKNTEQYGKKIACKKMTMEKNVCGDIHVLKKCLHKTVS